jgi:tetratricopeptide (TPR) repeat protein
VTTRVRLLGRPLIEDAGQSPVQPPVQAAVQPRGHKSWAVLARLAMAERPLTRRELAEELFAEADDPLGALRWSLADVRRSLGRPDTLRGDPLRLSREDLWVDVWELEDGCLVAADVGGLLLEGIDLAGSPGFDTWLMLARSRVAARSLEELRCQALDAMTAGAHDEAVAVAGRAAALDPLDEPAQELFVRALVAAGRRAQASVHVARSLARFSKEGLVPSESLRSAATATSPRPLSGRSAQLVAGSLLRAGTAALAAGAAGAGIDTLRRAADEACRADAARLEAEVLTALGGALVHAVRGEDGEGTVVLHRALAVARDAGATDLAAEILRELAFVDVQAGRHASATRNLLAASAQAEKLGDEAVTAGILAIKGMNEADRGRHTAATATLARSARTAERAGSARQQAWSVGVMARSLLLSGRLDQARAAAEASIRAASREEWTAYLPWPQSLRAHVLGEQGDLSGAAEDAEVAFTLACEIGDPCWEGMAARALGVIALRQGEHDEARTWLTDARLRCDRVSDRYVWVSAYIGLADLHLAAQDGREAATAAAARLYDDAVRGDLPEFLAWALTYQAELGDRTRVPLARAAVEGVENPALQARVLAL